MAITAIKGMNDIVPGARDLFLDSAIWDRVLAPATSVLASYGYRQVLLPIVENTSLFARSIGSETDIVSKEMYSFTDRGGETLTLRPEGTAGAVRSYIEHNFGKTSPLQRWWYFGPMFRAERPQKGRYRQFYQIGAELFAAGAPTADAEMIIMLARLCEALGLDQVGIRVNSLGDNESRIAYRETLTKYLSTHQNELCEACQRRSNSNPLRVLDCKRTSCKAIAENAPDIMQSFSKTAQQHFEQVLDLLANNRIEYQRDPRLVRGLDYYTGTIFEFTSKALGAQDALLGGGRYDRLVNELGGPDIPAIGFAAGIERLTLAVAEKAAKDRIQTLDGPHLYIASMPGAEKLALSLGDAVRSQRRHLVEVDVSGKGLKAQLKRADRAGARFALVLGEDELVSGKAKLKDLRSDLHPTEGLATMVELNGKALVAALDAVTLVASGAKS
ncbi:MAG: histidine--tRNA ligase [Deltaproteobacteria bacterium]|nr:histidine--tRNA ligase [Deltaproteobacteria bacterium]